MKLLSYRWVKAHLEKESISEDKVKQSFGHSSTYRELLQVHIQRELTTLDKDSQLSKLADKPNRGEFLLGQQAKREALNNILELLIDNI